jgi:hypothetical protein
VAAKKSEGQVFLKMNFKPYVFARRPAGPPLPPRALPFVS